MLLLGSRKEIKKRDLELSKCQKQIGQLELEVNEKSEKLIELMKKSKHEIEKKEEIKVQLQKLEEQLQNVTELSEKGKREIKQLKSSILSNNNYYLNNLEETNQKHNSNINNQSEVIKKLKKELQNQKEDIKMKEKDLQSLNEEMKKKGNENEDMKKKEKDLRSESEDMRSQIEKLKNDYYIICNDQLKSKLEIENQDLKVQLQKSEKSKVVEKKLNNKHLIPFGLIWWILLIITMFRVFGLVLIEV